MKTHGLIQRSLFGLKKAWPTILPILGMAGTIATAALAIKATPKAMRLLQQEKEAWELEHDPDHELELTKMDIVQITWKSYIPAALVGFATLTCIAGAGIVNKRAQKSLASAYALLSEGYKRYRESANSVFGEDADSRIISEIAKKSYLSADGMAVYDPDDDVSEETLFYDLFSKRYFNSTMAAVINGQYHTNRNLQLRGEVPLNEYYEFIGLSEIPSGEQVGWSLDSLMEQNIMWLDFDNRKTMMDDGMECYIIMPFYEPEVLEY